MSPDRTRHLANDVTWPVKPYRNAYCNPNGDPDGKLLLTDNIAEVTCKRCIRQMRG